MSPSQSSSDQNATSSPDATGKADEEFAPLDPRRVKVILIAVASSLFLASMGQTVVATALPQIVGDLGGLHYISWVVTAYLLASTIGAPISGKLGDMYGRKIVLQSAIGVFLTGAAICALAYSLPVLILGRVLQGLGGGSLIVVSMVVVADYIPPRERARSQGALSAVFGVSTVLGPLFGGFMVQNVSWHWIFWANFPVGLAAFVVLYIVLDKPAENRPHKVDFIGAFFLMILLSATVLIANMAGTVYDWSSLPMLLLLAIVPLAFIGFITVERRASEPVLPLLLFRIRNFQVSNSVNFLVGMAMFGTISFMPMFMQVVKGVPPVESGLYLLPMMLGLIGTSFVSGRYVARTGKYKRLPTISTTLLAVAMICMSTLGPDTPKAVIALFMFMTGVGIGPTMSVSIISIQSAIPREHLGIGTASANMFRLTGGSIGTSIFGAIFAMGLGRYVRPLIPGDSGPLTADLVAGFDPALRAEVIAGFSAALTPAFFIAALTATLACLASLRLQELPLASYGAPRQPAE